MYLINYCSDLISGFGMNEDHFKLKNKFSIFLVKNVFLTKIHKFLEFHQISILTLGYPGFQKKKCFCDKPILKTRVKVNMHPLSPPTRIPVTIKFWGIHTLNTCSEKMERGNTMKLLNWMHELMFSRAGPEIWKIQLPDECGHDVEKMIPSKFWVVTLTHHFVFKGVY